MTEEGVIKKDIMNYLSTIPGMYARILQIGKIPGRTNSSKGMSDIFIWWRGRSGVIEVKTKKGKISKDQREFLTAVESTGNIAIIATCVEDIQGVELAGEVKLDFSKWK